MGSELILRWMSEIGSGEISDLRSRVAWWARTRNLESSSVTTGRWLRDVSALGHAEIDWTTGRWAIAPAAGALIPGGGGTAVLSGTRRQGLLDAIDETGLSLVTIDGSSCADNSTPPPEALFLQADSMHELISGLTSLGVCYVGEAALNIAVGLKPISVGDPAAPPPWNTPVEHLSRAGDTVRFLDGLPEGDGLCRIDVLGRPSYLYRLGSSWYHTDHATGIFFDLAVNDVNVMRWRADRVSDGRTFGTLFVDQGAPLPPLQARALVLCSGLPTRFGQVARTAIYRNVPRDVAVLIAQSVLQTLSVLD